LNEAGKDCTVIEYLKNTPSKDELREMFNKMGIRPAGCVRKNELEFKENNLSQYLDNDDKLLEMMVRYPKIIERPIILTDKGAVIGRPPENIHKIL